MLSISITGTACYSYHTDDSYLKQCGFKSTTSYTRQWLKTRSYDACGHLLRVCQQFLGVGRWAQFTAARNSKMFILEAWIMHTSLKNWKNNPPGPSLCHAPGSTPELTQIKWGTQRNCKKHTAAIWRRSSHRTWRRIILSHENDCAVGGIRRWLVQRSALHTCTSTNY